jgi:hypothetical protein
MYAPSMKNILEEQKHIVKHAESRSRLLVSLVVLCLIGVAGWYVVSASDARGPYWLSHNLDPEYNYLLNGLNLAEGHAAGHYDHPGTPVQMLGAVVLRLVHSMNKNSLPLERDVCVRPEYYLRAIHLAIDLLVFCALAGLVFYFYAVFGDAVATMIVGASLFASSALLLACTRVNPEPMLVFSGFCMQIILVAVFSKRKRFKSAHCWFAAVGGFGVAVKVTFLPLLLVPLVVIDGWKKRALYLAGSFVFFIVFTLPIAVHYKAVARWLFSILTHTGRYGYGNPGIVDPASYGSNIMNLLAWEPALAATLVVSGMYLFAISLRKSSRRGNRTLLKTIAGCVAALVAQILMVAKHPDDHYLVPALCFVAFTFAVIIVHARTCVLGCGIMAFFGTIGLMLMVGSGIVGFRKNIAALDIQRLDGMRIATMARGEKGTPVYGYCASAMPYALFFGNSYAGNRYGKLLTSVYGNVLIYDFWLSRWRNYEREVAMPEIAAVSGGRLLYQGYSFESVVPGLGGRKFGGAFDKIAEASGEALYRVALPESGVIPPTSLR